MYVGSLIASNDSVIIPFPTASGGGKETAVLKLADAASNPGSNGNDLETIQACFKFFVIKTSSAPVLP